MSIKYNLELLKSICEKDNCIVNFDNYKKLNSNVKIIEEEIVNQKNIYDAKLIEIGACPLCGNITASKNHTHR